MAESSWPSPSVSRTVNDLQYEKLGISYGSGAGVYGDFTSPQLVYADSTGMQFKVAADRYAFVRGHEWWSGSSIITTTVAANASGSTRIDMVVLRLSRTTWDVNLTVITGTPGAGVPAVTQNTGTTGSWDLPLAYITVANGAATIAAGNVTYVASHLDAAGQYRVPSTTALTYVPAPTPGMEAVLSDGTKYRYDTSSWVLKQFAGASGARILFVPTLTATSNPNLGTGSTRVGWYCYLPGPSILYNFHIAFGTSPTAGSGSYAVSVPVAAGNPNAGAGIPGIGSVQMADASSGSFHPTTCFIGNSGTTLGLVGTAPVTGAFPWTWAAGDYMAGQIIYPI